MNQAAGAGAGAWFEACLEEASGDAAFVAKALGDIARAKGMAQVARDAGLSRESLYKVLSGERSPGFDTTCAAVTCEGQPQRKERAPRPRAASSGNYRLTERLEI
jgi:probable addiction module antidote protein